jgi:alcohol dehydrogenase, propanol-preferring
MRAWSFTGTNEPLVLTDIPEPVPGLGEVVLKIRASGICHTDVSVMTDPSRLETMPVRPIVIGHEIAGVVMAIGPGVTGVKRGDRCGVWPVGVTGSPGQVRDGGFTFQHRVPAEDLVPVPDGLAFELAAIGTDAGMTSYHAVVTQGAVGAGDKVGIVGLGGLGQFGVGVAAIAGAEVHVAEVKEALWPLAVELGARSVVGDVGEWVGNDLDVIVDFVGVGVTMSNALRAIRRGGRVVLVGMGASQVTLDTMTLIRRQVQVYGSHGGTKDDISAVYELLADGRLHPAYTVIDFDAIPQGIADLEHQRVTGRLVARVWE